MSQQSGFPVKNEQAPTQPRLALLIDADNAQAAIVSGLFSEIATLGIATVRRIYGDFTTPQLGPWKSLLLDHSITPVQQFAYTTGKNATDSSLIIDAMDLLYTGNLDGFCIVSSDSDFTKLASRLRESGALVYGFGEQKTPKPFVNACTRFFYTEILRQPQATEESPLVQPSTKTPVPEIPQDVMLIIRQVIEGFSDDGGWALLSAIGGGIYKVKPDFDSRTYGLKKLSDLIKLRKDEFEVEERGAKESQAKVLYVRLKRRK